MNGQCLLFSQLNFCSNYILELPCLHLLQLGAGANLVSGTAPKPIFLMFKNPNHNGQPPCQRLQEKLLVSSTCKTISTSDSMWHGKVSIQGPVCTNCRTSNDSIKVLSSTCMYRL